MNIFHRVALQGMKRSRTRTVVTVIGVILSAALITGVATFAASLLDYMINGAMARYGGWHVLLQDADAAFVAEQAGDDRVASVAVYEEAGYTLLEDGQNPDKPYLFVAGFSEEAFDTLPLSLLSGRLPQNSGEILVPAHLAANGGVRFQVGDTISLAMGSRVMGDETLGQQDPYAPGEELFTTKDAATYTVVGICLRPAFEATTAPGYTLITTASGGGDRYGVLVTLANPRQVKAYTRDAAHDYLLNDNVLRFMGLSEDTVFNTLLCAVAGMLVALITIGSVFLIYNSFSISLSERTRQLGMLSSVGATARQLRHSVLFEGLCIGAVGIPVGTALGIGGVALMIPIVARSFGVIAYGAVPLTLSVSVPAIAGAALVSMGTILLSADLPARKAVGRPVMESIRQTGEIKPDPKAVRTPRLVARVCGLEGTLALKSVQRYKKRHRSLLLSLVLSVVLFLTASAFGMFLRQAAEGVVVDTDYDICFSTQTMGEDEVFWLYEQLQAADGVTGSSYQAILTYSCAVSAGELSDRYREFAGYTSLEESDQLRIAIQFIEDGAYWRFVEDLGLPAAEFAGDNAKMTAVAKASIADQAGHSELVDIFVERSTELRLTPEYGGERVAGREQLIDVVFVDTIPLDLIPGQSAAPKSTVLMIVAPYEQKARFDIPGASAQLGLTFRSDNPSRTAAHMAVILQGAGITSSYDLYNLHEILEQNRNILFVMHLFTYVFVGMIALVAVANVFNTVSTNVRLRRRELAMLRSVGMSDRSLTKMMRFECGLYGLRTLLLGLPMAAVIIWLIHRGLVAGGADIGFGLPWASIVVSVAGVFGIVFLTMGYAIGKIKREGIIDALRDDMT